MNEQRVFGLTVGRLEAFSDGVFAFAATLLVVSIQVPHPAPGQLLSALIGLWPAYATYAASFLTIGIMWLNHHGLCTRLQAVDRRLAVLNLLLLMIIAFIPFPTAVLGESIRTATDPSTAAAFYAAASLAMGLGFASFFTYIARHPRLRRPEFQHGDFFAQGRRFPLGLAVYLACIPLAWVNAPLVVLLVGATAIYYAFDHLPGPDEGA